MRVMLAILAVVLMPVTALAQEKVMDGLKKNEVSLSVGSFLGADFSGHDDDGYDKYSVSTTLGYMRRINRTWAFGASLTHIYNEEKSFFYTYYETNGYVTSYNKYRYFGLMATAKASWAKHTYWNFYSRAAVGPALTVYNDAVNHNEIKWYGVLQISPVGFEAGSEKLRGFLELGFGIQGFVNAGVAYRF